MAPFEGNSRHGRLHIEQKFKWTSLEAERDFLAKKADHCVTHEDYLGPIIRKRLEWLKIPLKRLAIDSAASPSDTVASPITASPLTASPITASPIGNPTASPNPRRSRATRRSTAGRGASTSPLRGFETPADRGSNSAPQLPPPRKSLEPFVSRKDCASPIKRGGVGNNVKTMRSEHRRTLRPLKALALAESFLQDLPERLTASLIDLELPENDVQRKAIEALRDELETAIVAVCSNSDVSGLAGVARTFSQFLTAVKAATQDEAALTRTWCRVCNHAWAFLREHTSQAPSQAGAFSPETVACPGDSDDDQHLLFHDTSNRSTVPDVQITSDDTRPDIQGLRDAKVPVPVGRRAANQQTVQWFSSDDPSHLIALTSQELKADPNKDLGREVIGQVLRNMYKCFQHQEGLARTCHLTVAGSRIRLWMCDASSLSTSRAYDALEKDDALGIAQLLAFMCSSAEQIAPACKPREGMILHCDYPPVYDASGKVLCFSVHTRRYFRIVSEVKFMPQQETRLWGRHTACWSASAEEIDEGPAVEPDYHHVAGPPNKRIPLILKAGWLPAYLRNHEYDLLRILHQGEREDAPLAHQNDFPWALGIVDLSKSGIPELMSTARLPHIPRSEEDSLEVDDQTAFVLLAQKCPRGLDILATAPASADTWTIAQHVRVLRDLLRLLKRVSEKGIHYRDINLGNFALKPGFEEMLSDPEQSVLMLFDFGNSRYLDEHRGGQLHPRARGIRLGVDDALSVNANFLSHRTLACMQLLEEAAAQHKAGSQKNLCKAKEKFQEAQRLEHRFVDDCESAIWAYLRLIQTWCKSREGRDTLESLFARAEVAETRMRLWQKVWGDEMGVIETYLPEDQRCGWADLFEELNKLIWNCQMQLHQPSLFSKILAALRGCTAPEQLLRGKISSGEIELFDQCDKALNAFLGFGPLATPAEQALAPIDMA